MPLQIIRNDLTRVVCDAVVNPTDEILSGSVGTDAALHRAAGPELEAACAEIGVLSPGEAAVTPGFLLPAKHVIHTVGPRWAGGDHGERETLARCYRSCLAIAAKEGFSSVAFPIIAAGTFGFPKDEALEIATREIRSFLAEHEMDVILVVYDPECYDIGLRRRWEIRSYLDRHYDAPDLMADMAVPASFSMPYREESNAPAGSAPPAASKERRPRPQASKRKKSSFSMQTIRPKTPEFERELDESFSEMLLRKIDERGMTDPECYKRANVDRKLFSKIRSNPAYRPSKTTALAFAVALELDLNETRELLMKAGYALSHSFFLDVIVEYFIENRIYDVFEINEALFAYDQSLLGGA